MKTIKILSLILISMITLSSCMSDEVDTDANMNTPSMLSFVKNKISATIIADGSTADFTLPMKVKGPLSGDITNDITATISVDPSSTAVEGLHYSLGSTAVTFSPSNNLITSIDLTVMSTGVTAPAEVTLILNITNSSDSAVGPSGRTGQSVVTIKYLCSSDLAGEYTNPDVPGGAAGEATFTENSPGQYTISAMPYLGWGGSTPITMDILDDCGTISVTNSELMEAGYLTIGTGTVNADGSITINYIVYNGATVDTGIFFDFSAPEDASTYTPIP